MKKRENPQSIIIYYFSGTGNAKFAAEKIAFHARQNNIPVSLNNIASSKTDFKEIDKNCLVVFCYPTHGFNAPPVVLNFISKFPKNKSRVLLLNTRAGMKLFKMHTPGLGGIALWLPSIMLLIKGYKPSGWQPLDMPSNWISLHPGLRLKSVAFIISRCEQTLAKFTEKGLIGKPILTGLFWLPVDILLIPVAVGYYFFGRFAIAKTFYANYNCTNCGACLKNCPVNAIIEKYNRPFWTFKCESCMKCMNSCPDRAIETAHGLFIAISILSSITITFLLNNILKFNIQSGFIKLLLFCNSVLALGPLIHRLLYGLSPGEGICKKHDTVHCILPHVRPSSFFILCFISCPNLL